MHNLIEKAREYILALKEAGNFSYEDMANISGHPAQTIRNICSGKHEPRFVVMVELILALGGDLNELVGYEKRKEIEVNSTVSLKETFEMRIADLINSYETRIADIKELCEIRIADVQKCCDLRIADIKSMYENKKE